MARQGQLIILLLLFASIRVLPQYLSPEFYITAEQYKSSFHLAHHLMSNALRKHATAFKAAISLCCNRSLAFPTWPFPIAVFLQKLEPGLRTPGCVPGPNAAAAASSCLFCTCLSQPLITTLSLRWPAAIPG